MLRGRGSCAGLHSWVSAAAKAARRHDLCFGQLCCAGGGVRLTIAARQRRQGQGEGGVAPWTLLATLDGAIFADRSGSGRRSLQCRTAAANL